MNGRWISSKKACEFYGVTGNTLRRWADSGSVEFKRTPGNQRTYFVSSDGIFTVPKDSRENYLYVRVSSQKQKDDMERQISFLSSKYPGHIIVKDIASGLNYKRKGLLGLLEKSNAGKVNEIVVFSKDRLCRFGFELLEWSFLQNNTKLVVHEQSDESPEQEFDEDILAILQVFACRWNGKRRYRINKKQEVQIEVKQHTEKDIQEMGTTLPTDIQ